VDPTSLAPAVRQEVPRARPEFRVVNTIPQTELVNQKTMRERLLAMLSLFFALSALVLAAVGLYGVLTYSVLQRRREIGIRMALGAPAAHVVRGVTTEVFTALLLGAGAGLAAGVASEQYLEKLLYHVKVTDASMLGLPVLTILLAATLASLPPVIHAVRIDPAATLRAE
jgi:ABC-type antimicrobial peptide transport system permease subunit